MGDKMESKKPERPKDDFHLLGTIYALFLFRTS